MVGRALAISGTWQKENVVLYVLYRSQLFRYLAIVDCPYRALESLQGIAQAKTFGLVANRWRVLTKTIRSQDATDTNVF